MKITEKKINNPITVSITDVCALYGIGRNKAAEFGAQAGARVKLGKRVLYRVDKLNAYIESLTESAGEREN